MKPGIKMGIYVGSFNPPHVGHQKVAEYVLDKKIVDKVLILPTPNYWNKTNLVSIDHRVNMLRFMESEHIIVDDIHNNYPYTYQVLEALEKDYPCDSFYLIIGSDNLRNLHLWKNIEKILKHHIIVLNRGGIYRNPELDSYEKQFIYCYDFYSGASSTDIRSGKGDALLKDVRNYIEKHHLYDL